MTEKAIQKIEKVSKYMNGIYAQLKNEEDTSKLKFEKYDDFKKWLKEHLCNETEVLKDQSYWKASRFVFDIIKYNKRKKEC